MIGTRLMLTFATNRQLRNSLYLLLGSLATAGFGFMFWIIAARLFDAPTVGMATVLISLSSLISLLSLAGFDSSFVRFLPKTQHHTTYVNSGIVVTTALSIIFSVLFLGVSFVTTPDLRELLAQPLVVALFVFLTIASSLNLLTNSVFIAHRHAWFVLVINVLFNLVKVVLPFAFVDYGAVGIFVAAGIAQVVGLGISIFYMRRSYGYRFHPTVDTTALTQTFRYTFSVYIGSVLNLLPPTLLPLMITAQLDAASTAYYYMAFNIATIIYTIAYSAMQSAFAESSHDESALRQHIAKAMKLTTALVIPAIVLCVTCGGLILGVFGADYAAAAAPLLIVMSLAALVVAPYSALGAIMKVAHDTSSFIMMNLVYTLSILGLAYTLMPEFGLIAIGYSWLAGNLFAIVVGVLLHIRFRRAFFARERRIAVRDI